MRIALLALAIACGTAEALQPDGGAALTVVPAPWYGSPCNTTADCVPAGQSVPSGVTCDAVNSGGPKACHGGTLACEIFADGGTSACGPGACCWGPTAYNTDGGQGWHDVPGAGTCQIAVLPGYCSRVRP